MVGCGLRKFHSFPTVHRKNTSTNKERDMTVSKAIWILSGLVMIASSVAICSAFTLDEDPEGNQGALNVAPEIKRNQFYALRGRRSDVNHLLRGKKDQLNHLLRGKKSNFDHFMRGRKSSDYHRILRSSGFDHLMRGKKEDVTSEEENLYPYFLVSLANQMEAIRKLQNKEQF